MFGFFKRKSLKSPVCGYCGEPRPIIRTGEAGADDLLKNSKLSHGDYTVVCQKCESSIGARYNYQSDYSSASESSGSDSLSTGEREDLAEAPPEAIPAENYQPGVGYHTGAEDDVYGTDGGQGYDPDAPYEPSNGYRTDDEIREDNQPDETLTVHLFGSSVDLPAPVRRALPRLAIFFAISLAVSFWPDRETGFEPSTRDNPMPGAVDSVVRSSAIVPATPAGDPGEWILPSDYPTTALREERSGTVGFQLEISATGDLTACNILASSGQADLDEAACSALMRRARFNPAQDARGEPVRSSFTNKVRWEIPQ